MLFLINKVKTKNNKFLNVLNRLNIGYYIYIYHSTDHGRANREYIELINILDYFTYNHYKYLIQQQLHYTKYIPLM
jgi:hypothetical protein